MTMFSRCSPSEKRMWLCTGRTWRWALFCYVGGLITRAITPHKALFPLCRTYARKSLPLSLAANSQLHTQLPILHVVMYMYLRMPQAHFKRSTFHSYVKFRADYSAEINHSMLVFNVHVQYIHNVHLITVVECTVYYQIIALCLCICTVQMWCIRSRLPFSLPLQLI